eukprot:2178560-Pyramimonas_sp.AAC.1
MNVMFIHVPPPTYMYFPPLPPPPRPPPPLPPPLPPRPPTHFPTLILLKPVLPMHLLWLLARANRCSPAPMRPRAAWARSPMAGSRS